MTITITTTLKVGVIAAALLLSGCGASELQKAQGLKPQGTAFSKNLYTGYIVLATEERAEDDYRDSDVFAMRASTAATGRNVMPEAINMRKLPPNKTKELAAARTRLISALNSGARDYAPAQAAVAQVKFDCWMQEQEENFQPRDIERCRSKYFSAVAMVEAAKPAPKMAPSPPPPAPAPAPQVLQYNLEFGFNKSRVNLATSKTLSSIIKEWKGKSVKVKIIGHADTIGPEVYNRGLSLRRAESVKQTLIDMGINQNIITAQGMGESKLLIKTGDNVRKRENRRVLLSVTTGN